jgi:hypothetical protein
VLSQVIKTELPGPAVGGTHTGRLGRASSGTRVIEAIKLYNPKAIQPNRSWNSERELSEL